MLNDKKTKVTTTVFKGSKYRSDTIVEVISCVHEGTYKCGTRVETGEEKVARLLKLDNYDIQWIGIVNRCVGDIQTNDTLTVLVKTEKKS